MNRAVSTALDGVMKREMVRARVAQTVNAKNKDVQHDIAQVKK